MHSRIKHVEVRHHFIRYHIIKGDYIIEFIDTNHQLADIFTKLLLRDKYYELKRALGILYVNSLN